MAGSKLSGLGFVSLIEIAAFGSVPLNKSYTWHVSPVSCRATPTTTLASCGGRSFLVLVFVDKQFLLLPQQNRERGQFGEAQILTTREL